MSKKKICGVKGFRKTNVLVKGKPAYVRVRRRKTTAKQRALRKETLRLLDEAGGK